LDVNGGSNARNPIDPNHLGMAPGGPTSPGLQTLLSG
jgi:hypothetical protein